jgi:DeoR/GlpR family transcriptional regulator of sugar metabolism
MLANQRQALIMGELRRSGAVRVQNLTGLLGVSDMTVRRDLEQLADRGLVHKVHGGAVLRPNSSVEPGFAAKATLEMPAKLAIARLAATLIRPGSAIALSAGTTTWNLAPLVAKIPGLTIVTNSTTVADLIANSDGVSDQTLILTGGVRTPSAALVGPVADLSLSNLHVDQLFLGAHGMHPGAGFTTPNLAEAETNRALIECASQVVVCADSTKWGVVGLASFGPLTAADVLITDDGLNTEAADLLTDRVGLLRIAPPLHHAESHLTQM